MKLNLRKKFFLTLIITGLLPILVLGLLGIYLSFNYAKDNIFTIEKNLLNQKDNEIKNFISSIFENMEIIVTSKAEDIPYYKNLYDYEKFYNLYNEKFILQQLLIIRPEINEVSFIDLKGREKIKYYNEDQKIKELQNLSDLSKSLFFLKTKKGERFISNIFYTLNGPQIIVANPIKSKDNIVVGIIKAKISLSSIEKIIKNSILGETGYAYLLDNRGYLIYHSKLIENNFLNFNNLIELFNEKPLTLLRYKNKVDVYGIGKYLGNLNAYLVVEWPSSEASQVINRQLILIFFSLLIVIILTLGLGLLLSRLITNPLEVLKAGAQKVGQGKFEKIEEIKTGDELEDLTKEFNFMIDGLIQLQKLKDEFVYIASHELKAPVAAMKGYLTLLIDGTVGKIDKTAKEFMIKIRNSNERLIQLVQDLLQVARTEAGAIKIEVKPTDIKESVLAVINELKISAEQRGIEIIYEEKEIPKIYADPDRLKEILTNLVSNAIKYNINNGKIFIYHEIKNNELLTYVKDTGLGIPKDQQDKIFQKFFRVQSKATENIQGTGLGLFIVKQLVEKMNGKIWFESEEGKGTTFIFLFSIAG